jgi:hydroxymethylbilane synthase
MTTIRIGTRRSQLAMWQANHVRDALCKVHPDLEVEIVGITTQGDRTLDVPLATEGGKGLFLKELEQALLTGDIDLAVHSMKDVTVSLPPGLHIPVICLREDPHDALVSNQYADLSGLPEGAVVGTCSVRRQCMLKHRFPVLRTKNLRGNVNTRLKRLDAGEYDAIILAVSGLKRLKLSARIQQIIPADLMLPAVGQGALGIECRRDNAEVNHLIAPLDHLVSHRRISAERAVNEALGGGCHVPMAAYAEVSENKLHLTAQVGRIDGSELLTARATGPLSEAVPLGRAVAQDLIAQGAQQILMAYAG